MSRFFMVHCVYTTYNDNLHPFLTDVT